MSNVYLKFIMVGVIEISHFEFCNLFETEIKKTDENDEIEA